jgi:hypothetical protein
MGTIAPFVLRKTAQDKYVLVGEAYMHEFMHEFMHGEMLGGVSRTSLRG